MTSQQAQLQALITQIEALLGKAAPKLPWMAAGETSEQRRVMEQALAYLQELQATDALTPGWGLVASGGAIAPPPATDPGAAAAETTSQQVLQALLQEMQYLRVQMVQPLTSEVMALQQQRETLKNEVRQLELELERLRLAEASGGTAPNPVWVNEVVAQLRSSLLEQITPQLRALQAQMHDVPALSGTAQDPYEVAADLPQLSPRQRLEQLQQVQAQTDYLLLKLDANLRAVFESLDQSIHSYSDTLTQGLDAMHGLGQQGEFVFRTFINHLAQQLQQESNSFLSSGEEEWARLQDRRDRPATAAPLLSADDDDDDTLLGAATEGLGLGEAIAAVDLDDLDLDLVTDGNDLFRLF
ncbi:MAG TPA: hypothetical protein V6D02_16700, partial [Candidatus Obscuribacterales bacterium]